MLLGIVILGVTIAAPDKERVPPRIGDHWHAAYAIYNCNSFLPPLTDVVSDTSGLHTHDDGLMHLHPFASKYSGDGANIGNWGDIVGLDVTDTSIKAQGINVKNGDECGGKPGKVQLKVWTNPDDPTGRIIDEDFAKFAPQNFEVWTLAFVPAGADIPLPPEGALANLAAPSDLPQSQQPTDTTPVTGLPPEATSTTAPSASTTTSEP